MRLSTKLCLAMGTLLLGVVSTGLFSVYQMDKINDKSTEITQNWLPSTVLVQGLNTLTSDYRIYEINHIITENKSTMEDYEKRLVDTQKEIETNLKRYDPLVSSDEERRIFNEFSQEWKQYQEVSKQILTLSRDMKTREADAILSTTSRDLFNSASSDLLRAVNLNVAGGEQSSMEGDALFSDSMFMVIAVVLLTTLIGIGLCLFIVRDTLRSLGRDPAELQSLARQVAEGNLDLRHDDKAVGVFADVQVMVGNLKKNIAAAQEESQRAQEQSVRAQEAMKSAEVASNEAQAKTETMLKAADKLETVANIVSSASSELSAQIEQSERGASEQAARVTETATAMEEMNCTVLEVAKNAGAASDVSTSTRHKAEAGADIVRKSVKSIQDVQQQSLKLREDMVKLGENAQAISQIMSVISDIADQTNLLALNAAIEAARAGEAGRGFAVVADEVRKLAEKTMASTTDVGNAIKAIQTSASESMAQVDYSVKFIEEATEYANLSGKALDEIVNMVDTSADQVRAIATASEQQSSTSDEITKSISQVNAIAGETAQAMGEATRAVVELAGQAQVLSGLIEDMKRG